MAIAAVGEWYKQAIELKAKLRFKSGQTSPDFNVGQTPLATRAHHGNSNARPFLLTQTSVCKRSILQGGLRCCPRPVAPMSGPSCSVTCSLTSLSARRALPHQVAGQVGPRAVLRPTTSPLLLTSYCSDADLGICRLWGGGTRRCALSLGRARSEAPLLEAQPGLGGQGVRGARSIAGRPWAAASKRSQDVAPVPLAAVAVEHQEAVWRFVGRCGRSRRSRPWRTGRDISERIRGHARFDVALAHPKA